MYPNNEQDETSSVSTAIGFEHEPLPDPKTYIRLLKIMEAGAGQLARCTLRVFPLDTAPSYCAVSYTWGNPSDTTVIEINEMRKAVTLNCRYTLQQGYASDWKGYYWIDAICIDQSNDHEKSLQVAMMGDFYKGAAQVLACVGPEADDSDFLIRFLGTHRSFFERLLHHMAARKLYNDSPSYTIAEWGAGEALKVPRLHRSWLGLLLRRSRILLAINHFLERPYFSRVWV